MLDRKGVQILGCGRVADFGTEINRRGCRADRSEAGEPFFFCHGFEANRFWASCKLPQFSTFVYPISCRDLRAISLRLPLRQ
jgi:hypothetical protein